MTRSTSTGRASAPYELDAPLDLSGVSEAAGRQIVSRITSGTFRAWADTAARVGHCARPVRLRGRSTTVDTRTGEVVGSYSSDAEPLGLLHVRCGNRREAVCPSCSRTYAADTFQLVRAGVVGGKGVPATVSDNPMVFATTTAPSFGAVHGIRDAGKRCRPRDRARQCEHGRPVGCMAAHAEGDPLVGQPICGDCYDYDSHVIWQWWAPELWRRFTIALRRAVAAHLGTSEAKLGDVATVQYAKVAEFQARAVVHFHALIRLDGPKTATGFAPAPAGLDAVALAHIVQTTVTAVQLTADPAFETDPGRVLRFGAQVDARPVSSSRREDDPDQPLAPEQVAGYIAKYATKSAADTFDAKPWQPPSAHVRRIRQLVEHLGAHAREESRIHYPAEPSPYVRMGRWVHMLGFRGHFSTKSRRYSVTLGRLRRARRRWHAVAADSARTGMPLDVADLEAKLLAEDDDDATTLVIGEWAFVGAGWTTEGDAALARAAAARAREHAQERAQQRRDSAA